MFLRTGDRTLLPRRHVSIVCAATLMFSALAIRSAAAQPTDMVGENPPGNVRAHAANNSPVSEPTLDDVMNSALTAYGGKPALLQVAQKSTLFGEEKFAENANSSSYRESFKNEKWRLDLNDTVAGGDDAKAETAGKAQGTTVGFDGRRGWQLKNKEVTALSADDLQNYKLQSVCQPFLLAHWQEAGYKFNLLGRTTYKQAQVFAVEVQSPVTPGKITIFIDQQNYLVVSIQSDAGTKSGATARIPALLSFDYSQYRPVGGTLWPFKQIQFVDSSEVAQIDLKSVDLSTEMADTAFFAPSSGASTAAHLSKEIVVPFEYTQHEIVLKGRFVTGEEMEFLFDTGASDTLIDRRVAAEHFLPKDGIFNIAAMSGMVAAENSTVKRLELGKLIINDIPVKIIDLSGQSKHLGRRVAGIIGMNVIGRYLVSLDYSKPAVTFADADDGVRPPVKPVTFVKTDAPYVSAGLNGKESCNFLVDTGAAFNHMPENFARHFITGDALGKHFIEGTGLDGQPVRLGTVIMDNIILGGFAAKKISFTYPAKSDSGTAGSATSVPVSQKGGFFQDNSSGILGNPFWQNFIVTIDWKYQRLFLRNNPGFNARDAIQKSLAAGDTALTLHREYRDAEFNYQKALMVAESSNDQKERARLYGRLGNLRRLMAKDLKRPEHAKASYDYFTKAEEIAQKGKASDVEGRILADWSLLYADNGQQQEARTTMERGLALAPDDPNVNVDVAVQLYRSGLFPEMQKYVEKALFLDPDNWQALWYQVKLSENFNDTPRVVATLKDIARYYPWSKVAKDKLAGLLNKSTTPQAVPPGAPQAGAGNVNVKAGSVGANSQGASAGAKSQANGVVKNSATTSGAGVPVRSVLTKPFPQVLSHPASQ